LQEGDDDQAMTDLNAMPEARKEVGAPGGRSSSQGLYHIAIIVNFL
jgi:hypothetical protein